MHGQILRYHDINILAIGVTNTINIFYRKISILNSAKDPTRFMTILISTGKTINQSSEQSPPLLPYNTMLLTLV